MKWFLYFMSIYFIIAGITMILYPDWLRKTSQRLLSAMNLRWFFPLPLIFGVLCILSKDLTPHPWFIIIIGAFILGKGVYLLLSSKKHMDAIINWWIDNAQDVTYRFWGLIIFILGITLFSWL
jgi:hypothetical protein